MIYNILYGDFDPLTKILLIISLPIIVLVSLGLHEYAHAAVSTDLGDPTPRAMGRLSINPFKHLNLAGTLCMLLIGFGWANPVPVDPRHYKNPKKGMALCGAAGPAINLLIGLQSYFWYFIMVWLVNNRVILFASETVWTVYLIVVQILGLIGYYNVLLAVFNLLPIPPFDGSRILYSFLPDKYYFGMMKYEGFIMIAMLFLLLVGVFDIVIAGVHTGVSYCVELLANGFMDILYRLVGIIM